MCIHLLCDNYLGSICYDRFLDLLVTDLLALGCFMNWSGSAISSNPILKSKAALFALLGLFEPL